MQLQLDSLRSQYQQLIAEETEIERENSDLETQIKRLQLEKTSLNNKESQILKDSESLSSDFEEELELRRISNEAVEVADQESKSSKLLPVCFDFKFTYDNNQLLNLLSREILGFVQTIDRANESNYPIIRELIAVINAVAAQTFNVDCDLQVYGSYASGLNMPWSDIDLLLTPIDNLSKVDLELLAENLKSNKCFQEIKYIKSASMPVLKLTSSSVFNHIRVDITLNSASHYGLECVSLVKQYIQIYPSLKPLVLVLKQLLSTADLNDPYQQGLSSYGLVLMVVAFLQFEELSQSLSDTNLSLGQTLCKLLLHFGSGFDYQKWKIVPQLPLNNQGRPFRRVISSEGCQLPRLPIFYLQLARNRRPLKHSQQRCPKYAEALYARGTFKRCYSPADTMPLLSSATAKRRPSFSSHKTLTRAKFWALNCHSPSKLPSSRGCSHPQTTNFLHF